MTDDESVQDVPDRKASHGGPIQNGSASASTALNSDTVKASELNVRGVAATGSATAGTSSLLKKPKRAAFSVSLINPATASTSLSVKGKATGSKTSSQPAITSKALFPNSQKIDSGNGSDRGTSTTTATSTRATTPPRDGPIQTSPKPSPPSKRAIVRPPAPEYSSAKTKPAASTIAEEDVKAMSELVQQATSSSKLRGWNVDGASEPKVISSTAVGLPPAEVVQESKVHGLPPKPLVAPSNPPISRQSSRPAGQLESAFHSSSHASRNDASTSSNGYHANSREPPLLPPVGRYAGDSDSYGRSYDRPRYDDDRDRAGRIYDRSIRSISRESEVDPRYSRHAPARDPYENERLDHEVDYRSRRGDDSYGRRRESFSRADDPFRRSEDRRNDDNYHRDSQGRRDRSQRDDNRFEKDDALYRRERSRRTSGEVRHRSKHDDERINPAHKYEDDDHHQYRGRDGGKNPRDAVSTRRRGYHTREGNIGNDGAIALGRRSRSRSRSRSPSTVRAHTKRRRSSHDDIRPEERRPIAPSRPAQPSRSPPSSPSRSRSRSISPERPRPYEVPAEGSSKRATKRSASPPAPLKPAPSPHRLMQVERSRDVHDRSRRPSLETQDRGGWTRSAIGARAPVRRSNEHDSPRPSDEPGAPLHRPKIVSPAEAGASPNPKSSDAPQQPLKEVNDGPKRRRTLAHQEDPWLIRAPLAPTVDRDANSSSFKPDSLTLVGSSSINEYRIERKLGEGTFGVVTLGVRGKREPLTDSQKEQEEQLVKRGLRVRHGDIVALKEIIIHNESDGMPITSLREIRLLKSLDHPAIVPVVDIAYKKGDAAVFELGSTYMVFPYMDHDLAGLLENPRVKLELPHIKQYAKQLLEGTAYLHNNGLLHRDMKAANLLINNRGRLMIADFGLARSVRKASKQSEYTNCVVTRWYRPPELLLGEKKYHTPVDMWGVGCVMAEMFLKKPIFPGDSDVDQMHKIARYCGPPNNDTMPGYSSLPGFEGVKHYHGEDRIRHKAIEWGADRSFSDLLGNILILDPKKRLTADQALDHDWFWSEPFPAEPDEMPMWESSHEMDKHVREEAIAQGGGARPLVAPRPKPLQVPLPNQHVYPVANPSYANGQQQLQQQQGYHQQQLRHAGNQFYQQPPPHQQQQRAQGYIDQPMANGPSWVNQRNGPPGRNQPPLAGYNRSGPGGGNVVGNQKKTFSLADMTTKKK